MEERNVEVPEEVLNYVKENLKGREVKFETVFSLLMESRNYRRFAKKANVIPSKLGYEPSKTPTYDYGALGMAP
jgi:hypothetical protein